MVGHSPEPTVRAVTAQLAKGITTMLPTEDAAIAAGLLADRFGVSMWQFTLTATDANRAMIRYSRQITGKSKVLVMDYCYHGSVDETFATLDDQGSVVERRGNIGAPVDPDATTVVVPFNDVAALERAFASGDIACALVEPAMTNIGIVLPDQGWHEALRNLCTAHGAVLIIDETHTVCAGPGGMTLRDGLKPDAVVIGESDDSQVGSAADLLAYDDLEFADKTLGPLNWSTATPALFDGVPLVPKAKEVDIMSTVLEGGTPLGSQEQSLSSTPVDGRQQLLIVTTEMELLGLENSDLSIERMTELIGEAKEYSRELVKHKVFLRRADSANYSANIEPGLEDAVRDLRKLIRDLENRRGGELRARQAARPAAARAPTRRGSPRDT
jgi:hypothetical protein